MRGVLLETGNMSATIVANIVTVSIIATPEKMQIYTTLLQLSFSETSLDTTAYTMYSNPFWQLN